MATSVLFLCGEIEEEVKWGIARTQKQIIGGGEFPEKGGCIEIGNNVFILISATL